MASLPTLEKDISPPPTRKSSAAGSQTLSTSYARSKNGTHAKIESSYDDKSPSLAAIEAGEAKIRDHLEYFAKHLSTVSRPNGRPRLSIENFQALYERNQQRHGHHFVVHQHDHPISGVHYDLRLQFSDSSTVSWAIPYGLPGNPNSKRPNRMCIETRVHNLWNNLIETASHATGSLLIWDTGEYEVLPWKEKRMPMTDEELSDGDAAVPEDGRPHSERLVSAFKSRRIRLQLHGTRLPLGYTVSLRLSSVNDRGGQPKKPKRKRRRVDPYSIKKISPSISQDGDSADDVPQTEVNGNGEDQEVNQEAANASDDDEDATIRAENAYSGASNTIGSIHQRHWFLTLDRRNSGFRKAHSGPAQGTWVGDWEPFFVLGRDHERSVVTGRNADDVLQNENVEKFVGRKMWRPILE